MKAKIIKTEADYEAALAYIEGLMDAKPNSPEEEELELFSTLIEQYENEHYHIDLPDPIEAIKFRMEQQELTRKDMAAYIGSQSKVSEVLNRKRPLSLRMIRKLHTGLGIPAEVLLQEPGGKLEEQQYNLHDFPFTEMFKRGYFDFGGTLAQAKEQSEELLLALFSSLSANQAQQILYRKTDKKNAPIESSAQQAKSVSTLRESPAAYRVKEEHPNPALLAWQARVLHLAQQENLPPYDRGRLTATFLRDVVKLSYFETGPQLVRELLNKRGVHFIILPHLPKTYLDGACFISQAGRPVIGMTLRYDRADNFWFTLLHELAHVRLHLQDAFTAFFDDIEGGTPLSEDPREQEANAFARDLLIPPDVWKQGADGLLGADDDSPLRAFAENLRIHPAIVAGRVRWELKDYSIHSPLLGHKQIRKQFPEYKTR